MAKAKKKKEENASWIVGCPKSGRCKVFDRDVRMPVLERVGCWFECGDGSYGFHLWNEKSRIAVGDGDVFVYNGGVLWRLRRK